MPRSKIDGRRKSHSCPQCGAIVRGAGPFSRHMKSHNGNEQQQISPLTMKVGEKYRIEYSVPNVVTGKFEKNLRTTDGSVVLVKGDDGRTVSVKREWIKQVFR